ncbi:cyclic lactone autoinducer peptide [Pelotomaculum propionicicum]|nr:cyclic lactone autoinducer peptide [Pelotomaculum propionicicum]
MKKIYARLFVFTTALLLLLANVASASACVWSHYQPEVPVSLRK